MLKKLTSALDGRLKQLALATTTPQLTKPIGTASPQQYIAEAGYQKVGWRAWRRSLVFMASGQANVKINSLENAGKEDCGSMLAKGKWVMP